MKDIFRDKIICLLGDSLLQHGHYIYRMRSFIHRNKEKCIVLNRGLGGNTVGMALGLLDDEIFALKPDYCLVCFGANDLGIWLYDSFKEETQELLKKREARNNKYKDGVINTVKALQANNVIPILMSPFPMNQLLEEKSDIPTLADNKEKETFLGAWFYKRKTYEKLNIALREYNQWLKEYSMQNNILFFDVFDQLFNYMLTIGGIYALDGIHITPFGSSFIAKAILEQLGYQDVGTDFSTDRLNDEIFMIEQQERSVNMVRFHFFHPIYGDFTDQQIMEKARGVISDDTSEEWVKECYRQYLNHYGKIDKLTEKVKTLTNEYCK